MTRERERVTTPPHKLQAKPHDRQRERDSIVDVCVCSVYTVGDKVCEMRE